MKVSVGLAAQRSMSAELLLRIHLLLRSKIFARSAATLANGLSGSGMVRIHQPLQLQTYLTSDMFRCKWLLR